MPGVHITISWSLGSSKHINPTSCLHLCLENAFLVIIYFSIKIYDKQNFEKAVPNPLAELTDFWTSWFGVLLFDSRSETVMDPGRKLLP